MCNTEKGCHLKKFLCTKNFEKVLIQFESDTIFLGFLFLSVLVGEIKLKSSRNVFTPAVWSSTQGCYVTFLMRNKPFYKLKMAVFDLIMFCIPNEHGVCFKHYYVQTASKQQSIVLLHTACLLSLHRAQFTKIPNNML